MSSGAPEVRTCFCSSELVRSIGGFIHGESWDGIEGVYGYCDLATELVFRFGADPDAPPAPEDPQ